MLKRWVVFFVTNPFLGSMRWEFQTARGATITVKNGPTSWTDHDVVYRLGATGKGPPFLGMSKITGTQQLDTLVSSWQPVIYSSHRGGQWVQQNRPWRNSISQPKPLHQDVWVGIHSCLYPKILETTNQACGQYWHPHFSWLVLCMFTIYIYIYNKITGGSLELKLPTVSMERWKSRGGKSQRREEKRNIR